MSIKLPTDDNKDRFGETLRLVERAKEDIYFAQRDRELIEKLKAQLQKVEKQGSRLDCPKCRAPLESYTFHGTAIDRCPHCGGIWMDNGELDAVITKASRGPLRYWLDKLIGIEVQTQART